MFNNTEQHLGYVRVGHEQTVRFGYTDDVIAIRQAEGSCDCIDFKATKDNALVVVWKPKPIPHHLVELGQKHYYTQKTITVRYVTKTAPDREQIIVLLFDATVQE